MTTCASLPAKYANPFDIDHPAVLALLKTRRTRTSYAPATKKNRHWAARELYCLWMYGLLPHLPREVYMCLPLQLPERPQFHEIKAYLAGRPVICSCELGCACHIDILAYIANTSGFPVHPPLRGPVPERKRASSDADRDELARNAYRRSNKWGV